MCHVGFEGLYLQIFRAEIRLLQVKASRKRSIRSLIMGEVDAQR